MAVTGEAAHVVHAKQVNGMAKGPFHPHSNEWLICFSFLYSRVYHSLLRKSDVSRKISVGHMPPVS
jgi:hypothetical protein